MHFILNNHLITSLVIFISTEVTCPWTLVKVQNRKENIFGYFQLCKEFATVVILKRKFCYVCSTPLLNQVYIEELSFKR